MESCNSSQKIETWNLHITTLFFLYLCIPILPFVFFHWIMPFFSDLVIGNDYPRFPIDHQMELMFSLKTGSFPLYVPGFAGGQTASALTLGQLFHPISHIANLLPGYWNGNALEWNTFIRLISLGCAHLFIFIIICKFRLHYLLAFVLSTITVYNLQVLSNFQYGAALESWTGYLFLCASIGLYSLQLQRWYKPLLIIGSTYWLVCSGHPQMMYYGLLGAGLFTLLIPFFISEMLPEKQYSFQEIALFWIKTALWCSIGILLSSAYILPFYFDFISSNTERVARDYAWANGYLDTFMGTLNNFFQPLYTFVNGIFGGSSLFLVAALVPVLRIMKVKIPRVIWLCWIIIFIAFLHMQGDRLPIHYIIWKYFPLASSFRVPGRIAMVMPIFFMLIITWVISAKTFQINIFGKELNISPISFLSIVALLFMGVYFYLPDSITLDCHRYSANSIHNIPSWIQWITLYLGGIVLLLTFFYGTMQRFRIIICLGLAVITCVQIICFLRYGTWVQNKEDTISFERMSEAKKIDLGYIADLPGYGLSSSVTVQQAEKSFLEPFLGKTYRLFEIANNTEHAYSIMAEKRTPDKIILEGYRPDINDKIQGPPSVEFVPDQVELIYSSFNRLIFKVHAVKQGFFGLAYPFTCKWKAFVNGKATKTYRANGGNHAVLIPSGISNVEFRYLSYAAFVGMLISCLTFAITGFYFCFSLLQKRQGIILSGVILFLGIGGLFFWYKSLYTGENLNTDYSWNSRPSLIVQNIAYGKRTSMSSFVMPKYPYLYSSGCAVDGKIKGLRSGFITGKNKNPFWTVDLHHPQSIGSIKIFESIQGLEYNLRPIIMAFSSDNINWKSISINSKGPDIHLNFSSPLVARYIHFAASGLCHLSFDEVEIYPPDKIIKKE